MKVPPSESGNPFSPDHSEIRSSNSVSVEIPEESIAELRTIARVVGGDWRMQVEVGKPGEGSFFSEGDNRIAFDPLDIADPEKFGHAKFIAAHEGGHRAITRGPKALGLSREKAKALYQKLGFAFGQNALEDPADNNWWSRRYPGLTDEMKKSYDQMFVQDGAILGTPEIHAIIAKLGSPPRFAHFGSEVIRLWHTGTFSEHLPEDVRAALERVTPYVQTYFADIPNEAVDEDSVVTSARSRFQTFLQQVWPEMDALVQKDLLDERLRQMVQEKTGESAEPVQMDKLSEEEREALEEEFDQLPSQEKKKFETEARKILENIEDELNAEIGSKLDPDKPKSHEEQRQAEEDVLERRRKKAEEARADADAAEKIHQAIEADRNAYDHAFAEVAPMIQLLADDIDRIFLPNRQPRWRGNFPVGGRLDLRKAMQFEARPETYTQLWNRKTVPEKREFAFTLLVDLSGSMHGKKIEQTFKGSILLAEALSRVGIDIEVLGFQDKLIVFKDFGKKIDEAVRAKMAGMPAEVTNTNPGGLNHADYNDDGYAVSSASKRLQQRHGTERFLVVLSDGQPVPSAAHSGKEWDLKTVIAKLRAEKVARLAGVGLGPGTEHVRMYYPNSIVVNDVAELPRSLAALLEDILQNPHSY